jgi:dihydrodipicolinate synthase/N-acetylneuraminate lyase
MTSASNIRSSHTASEIIQLAKQIRRMGVSTVVIGSNIIIRPTPRNMKETTYDRKKQKINKH